MRADGRTDGRALSPTRIRAAVGPGLGWAGLTEVDNGTIASRRGCQ